MGNGVNEVRVGEICDAQIKQLLIEGGYVTKSDLKKCQTDMKLKDKQIAELQSRVRQLQISQETNVVFRQLLLRRIDDNEQYSRKPNLILDGFNINKTMTDGDIKRLVLNEIRRLDLKITPDKIDRAHRHGWSYRDKNGKQHTPIVCRFSTWTARDTFYNARRETTVYATADLTDRRKNVYELACEMLEQDSDEIQKSVKHVYVDRNCKLTAITTDGRHLKFSSIEEFARLPAYISFTTWPVARALRDLRLTKAEIEARAEAARARAEAAPAAATTEAVAATTEAAGATGAAAGAESAAEGGAAVSTYADITSAAPQTASAQRKSTRLKTN